ncbi:MAG: YkgJ family cysteine cluster protein [Candidatus Nezhaarchaeales archaeon]
MSHPYIKVARGEKVKVACLRCGRCCHGPNVSLTAFDICRIAKFMGLHWRDLRGRYVKAIIADMIAMPVLQSVNNICVFLEVDEKPTCTIYPARPMKCRLYPFLPRSPSQVDVVYLDECCKGIGTGELAEPPWNLLGQYCAELKFHYTRLYQLVFEEGCEPLQALERLIDDVYMEVSMSL